MTYFWQFITRASTVYIIRIIISCLYFSYSLFILSLTIFVQLNLVTPKNPFKIFLVTIGSVQRKDFYLGRSNHDSLKRLKITSVHPHLWAVTILNRSKYNFNLVFCIKICWYLFLRNEAQDLMTIKKVNKIWEWPLTVASCFGQFCPKVCFSVFSTTRKNDVLTLKRSPPPRNRLTPLPGILQTSHEYEPVISWVNRTRWIWWWPSKLIIVNRNRDIAIFTGFSVICYMTS